MGPFIALLLFILFAGATIIMCLGIYSIKSNPVYDKAKRKRLVNNIYMEQQLVKKINEDLDSINEPWFIKLFPFMGTRYHVRKDLKKLGCKL